MIRHISKHLIASLFWIYVTLKVFVVDIDGLLIIRIAPDYAWALQYRSFLFLSLFGIAFAFRKTKLTNLVFYVLFYPFILAFWRIPVALWNSKNSNLIIHVVNGLTTFISNIRFNISVLSFYIMSFVFCIVSSNKLILVTASYLLLAFLLLIYIQRVRLILRPTLLFKYYGEILSKFHENNVKVLSLDDELRNLPVPQMVQSQLQKYQNNLGSAVLHNRVYRVAAKKLKDYQQSGFPLVSGVLVTLLMLLITVATFSASNFGLYKIDPGEFVVNGNSPTYFYFFYYSFTAMVFNGIREITPAKPLAEALLMAQYFCSIFLISVFVSVIISVGNQRRSHELDNIIDQLNRESEFIASIIRDDYRFPSVEDAYAELRRVQYGLIRFVEFVSRPLE